MGKVKNGNGNTSHCEMLEKAAMMLYQVSDILDQLSFQDFVKSDAAWENKMSDLSTQICCDASDLAEFYGRTYIFNKLEGAV